MVSCFLCLFLDITMSGFCSAIYYGLDREIHVTSINRIPNELWGYSVNTSFITKQSVHKYIEYKWTICGWIYPRDFSCEAGHISSHILIVCGWLQTSYFSILQYNYCTWTIMFMRAAPLRFIPSYLFWLSLGWATSSRPISMSALLRFIPQIIIGIHHMLSMFTEVITNRWCVTSKPYLGYICLLLSCTWSLCSISFQEVHVGVPVSFTQNETIVWSGYTEFMQFQLSVQSKQEVGSCTMQCAELTWQRSHVETKVRSGNKTDPSLHRLQFDITPLYGSTLSSDRVM